MCDLPVNLYSIHESDLLINCKLDSRKKVIVVSTFIESKKTTKKYLSYKFIAFFCC